MLMRGTVKTLEGGRKRKAILLFFLSPPPLPSPPLPFPFLAAFSANAAAAVRRWVPQRNMSSSVEVKSPWFLLRHKGPDYGGKSQILWQLRQQCATYSGSNSGSGSSRSLGNTVLVCFDICSFRVLMGFGSDDKIGTWLLTWAFVTAVLLSLTHEYRHIYTLK